MVPGKNGLRKIGPRKIGPRKIGPRKNVFQKSFSVKRMLGNLNEFFIFIDWFHYTRKKMFDGHLTILHAPNCRTSKESRRICCRVLGIHRLITSEHSTHTHHDARRSPYRVTKNRIRFLVFRDHFCREPFFRGPTFQEPFFPGTILLGFVPIRVI